MAPDSEQHEQSPLLEQISFEERTSALASIGPGDEDGREGRQHGGAATISETIANMMKTCAGTGILALPYAAQQGGVLLYVLGLFAIAQWNFFCCQRLIISWDLLSAPINEHPDGGIRKNLTSDPSQSSPKRRSTSLLELSNLPAPPDGTATLGKLAWYTLGPSALLILDTLTVILLLGVVVAYVDAIRAFLRDTPFTSRIDLVDASLIALIVARISVVPDLSYLAKTSVTGLWVLGLTLLVVAGYGILGGANTIASDHLNAGLPSIQWYPRDGIKGVSQWFGCVVFGFGVVPLTFNFQESMAEPSQLPQAAFKALVLVAIGYIAVGLGLLLLYPNVESDILSELPVSGILPVITRMAMVIVILVTAPLLAVPCSEIIEGKLGQHLLRSNQQKLRIMVRFGVCFTAVALGVLIPQFVLVLTFVGCFCVAFVGFCIPPCFHMVLVFRRHRQRLQSLIMVDDLFLDEVSDGSWKHRSVKKETIGFWYALSTCFWLLWVDAFFLAWGLTATIISTTQVFLSLAK